MGTKDSKRQRARATDQEAGSRGALGKKKLAEAGDLYVARSRLGGRGVFARRPFRKGELVERCPYLRMDGDDVDGLLLDYVFEDTDDTVVLPLGYGGLYNHSSPGNLDHYDDEDDQVFEYYASCDIAAGEELCLDYGADWWETRGLAPRLHRRSR